MTSPQGIVNANGGYYILEQGKATNVALYLSDSWKIDSWLFDASARLEHMNLTQQTTNQSPVQLGSQFDLWDNAVDLPNGTYSHGQENQHHADVLCGRELRVHRPYERLRARQQWRALRELRRCPLQYERTPQRGCEW